MSRCCGRRGPGRVAVFAVLRRAPELAVPSRHLGLIPAVEHGHAARAAVDAMAGLLTASADLPAIVAAARGRRMPDATPWSAADEIADARTRSGVAAPDRPVTVAVAGGAAFTFGYAEHAELLAAAGAVVVHRRSPARHRSPAGTSALVVGGGFPEEHVHELAANHGLLDAVRAHARAARPIAAECAGLLYLARDLDGHRMADVVEVSGHFGPSLTLGYYRDAVAPTTRSSTRGRPRQPVTSSTAAPSRRSVTWAPRGAGVVATSPSPTGPSPGRCTRLTCTPTLRASPGRSPGSSPKRPPRRRRRQASPDDPARPPVTGPRGGDSHYLVGLDYANAKVVLVGGGSVVSRRLGTLAAAGAESMSFALETTPTVESFPGITVETRAYRTATSRAPVRTRLHRRRGGERGGGRRGGGATHLLRPCRRRQPGVGGHARDRAPRAAHRRGAGVRRSPRSARIRVRSPTAARRHPRHTESWIAPRRGRPRRWRSR